MPKNSLLALLLGGIVLYGVSPASGEVPEYPGHIANGILVYEIEEHQVVIKSPQSGGNPQDRHDLAGWACELYDRVAVGPLHGWSSRGIQYDNQQKGRYHLYACAIP